MNDKTESDSYDFSDIQKKFFSGYPVKEFNWSKLMAVNCSEEWQDALLNATILHPRIKQYPLRRKYLQNFARSIYDELARKELDASDLLCFTVCGTFEESESQSFQYRHFVVEGRIITIQESVNLISVGTTGLCSWQASQALAEWCFAHKNMVEKKNVLELGSGVGLTGIAVSLACKPRSYWFSDCHPVVLEKLRFNIALNADESVPQVVEETDMPKMLGDTSVFVLNLPWEEVLTSHVRETIAPDVILAADVVYDPSIFSPLSDALCHFLERPGSVAVLACTVRNEHTLDQFLALLRTRNLIIDEEDVVEPSTFFYSQETPIKIYRIKMSCS